MFRIPAPLSLCVLLVCSAFGQADSKTPPNIVLIVADDLGQRDLGCYGSTYHRTPHLDGLAKQSMRFTDAYAACPVCSPTRAALLTGNYPVRYDLTDWLPGRPDQPTQKLARPKLAQQLPLEAVTLAEALKSAGYTTGIIGKWHLGGVGFGPKEQGFAVNIAGDHSGTPLSYFAPFKNAQRSMPGLEQAPEGEYLTDRLAAEACQFITNQQSKPFFLYLPNYAVHTPMRAPKELSDKFQQGAPGRQGNPIYAAMLQSLDSGVGKVLAKLDELKLSDNTVVIFTSDNGGLATVEGQNTPATYNGPFREGKGYLYEGGVRVPLLIRWPGQKKSGSTTAQPVSSIDLFPTLLALANVTNKQKVDGMSLLPLLDDKPLDRDALYWHYPHYSNQGGKPGSAIRSGDYKLIEFFEDGRKELFDVKKDLSESRNLSADKPEVVENLAKKLAAWREQTGAKKPEANPNFVPNPQAADGSITLHARSAQVHGLMLRFEPLPHKNTLGFWVRPDDWASFEFTVTKPGTFAVEILQGCGKGSGGSEVEFAVGTQKLKHIVKDTGGFQAFEALPIGKLTFSEAGRQTLTVKPVKKPGVAVMDLRQIVLKPTP